MLLFCSNLAVTVGVVSIITLGARIPSSQRALPSFPIPDENFTIPSKASKGSKKYKPYVGDLTATSVRWNSA